METCSMVYSSVETTLSAASQPDKSQPARPDSVADLSVSILFPSFPSSIQPQLPKSTSKISSRENLFHFSSKKLSFRAQTPS